MKKIDANRIFMNGIGTKKRKSSPLLVAGAAAVGFAAAQLWVIGAKGGIGPLGFLRDGQMKKLPGNAAQYHPQNVPALEGSPLCGKRLLFLGSSVTYGSAALGVSMADYLAVRNNCQIVKEAVSGTTLVDHGKNSYVARLKRVDPSQRFDAVICQLSTNDATQKKPIGAVGARKSCPVFDTGTIAGAIEFIISYAQANWACPVIFYTGTKYGSAEYQKMVDLLLAIQQKWDIGIIDLWNDTELNSISDEQRALYMHDDIHPTQAGYLKWWVPKFEEELYRQLS